MTEFRVKPVQLPTSPSPPTTAAIHEEYSIGVSLLQSLLGVTEYWMDLETDVMLFMKDTPLKFYLTNGALLILFLLSIWFYKKLKIC